MEHVVYYFNDKVVIPSNHLLKINNDYNKNPKQVNKDYMKLPFLPESRFITILNIGYLNTKTEKSMYIETTEGIFKPKKRFNSDVYTLFNFIMKIQSLTLKTPFPLNFYIDNNYTFIKEFKNNYTFVEDFNNNYIYT